MRHDQKKTPENLSLAIAALRATGNVSAAARVVGATGTTVRRWYVEDKKGDKPLEVDLPEGERMRFHEAWDDALRVCVDSLAILDRERARGYWERVYEKGQPVYEIDPRTGEYLVDVLGDLVPVYKWVFNERSVDRQLKALDPETYRERHDVKHSGEVKTGVVVLPADMPPDEWEAMVKKMKAEGHDL